MAIIRKHEPVLDGIRGVAIILVLFTHIAWVFPKQGLMRWLLPPMIFGWCGVDLFFVLSGYLITGILIRTKAASNRATSFYMRRFLRIFPIYYLVLCIILLTAQQWLSMSLLPYYRIGDRIAYFAYLQNWLPFRHSMQVPMNILAHFWSLGVEEQFYLIWPWLVWSLSTRRLLQVCICGTVGSLALSSTLVWRFGPHLWIHMLTPTRGGGLLVGAALAAFLAEHRRIPDRLLLSMASIGAAVLALIAFLDPKEFSDTDAGPYMYTIGVSGLALFFGAIVDWSNRFVPLLTPALNFGWLKSFGKYSYGIYVYHIPLFVTLNYFGLKFFGVNTPTRTIYALPYASAFIGITFGVAWVSYNFFESKLLNFKRHFEPVYQKPEVATAVAAGSRA